LSHCHKLGVFHCDLRPDNLLVDEDLNIRICDFGGSTCGELHGGGLPDFGFFDPRDEDVFTVSEPMEVFGLGSIMYSIMTGHRPHGPSVFGSSDSIMAYGSKFEDLLRQGIFPETKDIVAGEIILDCWQKKISSAGDVLERLKSLKVS
jgi:serine/threonine protein kinase